MRPSLCTALCLTAIAVLLSVPSRLWGQPPRWQASIAKVSVDPKLERIPGTAFVVAVAGQTALLVTCAHNVEEEPSPRVEFRAVPFRSFQASVRSREPGDNPRGLAMLVVENVPPEVQALPLAASANPLEGEKVTVAGFPRPRGQFLAPETTIAGYEGQDLTLSRETIEGFSGGPVLRGDLAIGIVYGRGGYGMALVSDSVRIYLKGLNVPLPPGVLAGDTRTNGKSGLKDVWIPPGTFQMGCSEGDTECDENEKPAHPVTITKGFWMGQTAVTVGSHKRYSLTTGKPMPREPKTNRGWSNEGQPMVMVNWDEAAGYCAWTGMRLPTEAEWEYAARAGSREARYGSLDDIAWFVDNSGHQRLVSAWFWKETRNIWTLLEENGNGPKEAGQKRPNAWKLYDMLGNVAQWTADWYGEKYYQARDGQNPQGPPGGESRVLRGGSWYSYPRNVRVSSRYRGVPENRDFGNGFRCAGE